MPNLSDNAVQAFMQYAWALTPQKFTTPEGQVIEIDRSKPETVQVPVAKAREVIEAGIRSAQADACELIEDQVRNFGSLMRRERNSKQWTDGQIVYINQLHLATLLLLSGRVKREEDGKGGTDVTVAQPENEPKRRNTCTEEERAEIRKVIDAYVASEPAAPADGSRG
ncbi:MAG: hypothetical protein ACFCUN_07000 [Hyphomicrobiaceae bacterium]